MKKKSQWKYLAAVLWLSALLTACAVPPQSGGESVSSEAENTVISEPEEDGEETGGEETAGAETAGETCIEETAESEPMLRWAEGGFGKMRDYSRSSFPGDYVDRISELLSAVYTNDRNRYLEHWKDYPDVIAQIEARYPVGEHPFVVSGTKWQPNDSLAESRTEVCWVAVDFGDGYRIDGRLTYDREVYQMEYDHTIIPNQQDEVRDDSQIWSDGFTAAGSFTIDGSGKHIFLDFLEKEELLRCLWPQVVSYLGPTYDTEGYDAEYAVEAYLEDFTRNDVYYHFDVGWNHQRVEHWQFCWADRYDFWWKDQRTVYREAMGKMAPLRYEEGTKFELRETGIFKISGSLNQYVCRRGEEIPEEKAMGAFSPWDTALMAMAVLYQDKTGDITGEMRGQIYLEEYASGTDSGGNAEGDAFVICLEGEIPVRVKFCGSCDSATVDWSEITWSKLEPVPDFSPEDMLFCLELDLTTDRADR